MSTQFSNQLVIAIGKHLFRTDSWTMPTTLYLALFTTNPDANGDGGVEVSGDNYARIACGPGITWWSAPEEYYQKTRSYNLQTMRFAQPASDWGTVTGIGLMDSLVSTTPLAIKTLTQVINSGDPMLTFLPGSLVFELS